jgi:hypothetical protein
VPPEAAEVSRGVPQSGAGWADASEAAAPVSASAPAVAEAVSQTWTQDGALAAASVLFAGTWLRWHAAHQRDENRTHRAEAPVKPKVQ